MTNTITNKSLVATARISGLLYLLLAIGSAYGYNIFTNIFVSGNTALTIENITSNELLFRISIVSSLLGQVAFALLAVALYQLFKDVDKIMAKVLVVLIIVAVPIAFVNSLCELASLILINSTDYSAALGLDAINSLIMFFFETHKYGIIVVSIFWGLWLFPFGYLAFKSGFIPRIIGILLIFNGFVYLVDSFSFLLIPGYYDSITKITNIFIWIGEVAALLWLLIIGAKPKKA